MNIEQYYFLYEPGYGQYPRFAVCDNCKTKRERTTWREGYDASLDICPNCGLNRMQAERAQIAEGCKKWNETSESEKVKIRADVDYFIQ